MRKVTQPEGTYKLLTGYFRNQDGIDRKKEHFFVIHLDARNRVKFLELVSIGILNASLVHPREVFCRAVRECSSQIILAHNHPSGEVEPSNEDIATTKRLVQAGEILGIKVIDHVIYAQGSFCSFSEQRLL